MDLTLGDELPRSKTLVGIAFTDADAHAHADADAGYTKQATGSIM
jgi:hypothetical protein